MAVATRSVSEEFTNIVLADRTRYRCSAAVDHSDDALGLCRHVADSGSALFAN
jgi:hypothetical protein